MFFFYFILFSKPYGQGQLNASLLVDAGAAVGTLIMPQYSSAAVCQTTVYGNHLAD